MPDLPPRFSRLPTPPPPWQPTHRLQWVPRAGLAREWLVRFVIEGVAEDGPALAETLEEAQAGQRPSWTRSAGVWTWRGGGWNGERGVAMLLPLRAH